MTQEKEKFLGRWSRLKHEERKAVPEKKEEKAGEPPALPPVDKLTPESDFKGFMHPAVDAALRRAALKKLFSDPHFNVPDPYEAYSGDWTGGEPIPQELLAQLNQARSVLFNEQDKKPDAEHAQAPAAPQDAAPKDGESKQDEPRRQDA